MDKIQIAFYESIDRENIYTIESDPLKHPFYGFLKEFIDKHNLVKGKKCLEIGSGKGLFQDLVEDYTGVDIVEHLRKYYHKNFVVTEGALLPFSESSFDAIWTYATHEHIPKIETALREIIRVLKPGGVCLFAPAWHTRPWFAEGYQLRSYSELNYKGKLMKLSIPFRDCILVRWPLIFFGRLFRLYRYLFTNKVPIKLHSKKLRANYLKYWQSDSDACNSLDPCDVILWFKSRGIICHGYEKLINILLVRTYALELQKPFHNAVE